MARQTISIYYIHQSHGIEQVPSEIHYNEYTFVYSPSYKVVNLLKILLSHTFELFNLDII